MVDIVGSNQRESIDDAFVRPLLFAFRVRFRVEGYGFGIDNAFVRPLLFALFCNDDLLLHFMIIVKALMLPLPGRCASLYFWKTQPGDNAQEHTDRRCTAGMQSTVEASA